MHLVLCSCLTSLARALNIINFPNLRKKEFSLSPLSVISTVKFFNRYPLLSQGSSLFFLVCWEFLTCVGVFLPILFLHLLCWVLPFILLILCITLIDFLFILANPTFLLFIILSIHWWIWFVDVLLKIFVFMSWKLLFHSFVYLFFSWYHHYIIEKVFPTLCSEFV